MNKIRVNELARELEVKSRQILEKLPELGITEKMTHSSSIDEDVALQLRRIFGFDVPEPSHPSNGAASRRHEAAEETGRDERADNDEPTAEVPAAKPEGPTGPAPIAAEAEPERETERPADTSPSHAPIRPPLAGGRPIHPPIGTMPRPEGPRAPVAPSTPGAPPAPRSASPSAPPAQPQRPSSPMPPAAVIAP